jgi:hypothetical protein
VFAKAARVEAYSKGKSMLVDLGHAEVEQPADKQG